MRNLLMPHKGKPHDISQMVWWKPLFETQRNIVMSNKDMFKGTPFESVFDRQEELFEQAQENINRIFGEVFNNRQMISPIFSGNNTEPYIDIVENKDAFKIKAEIPGVKEQDLDISIIDGGLIITGEKYEQSTEKGESYVHQECHVGSFTRSIALPEEADLEKVKAELALSVLTIEVPKKAAAKKASGKKVNVESKPANNGKETNINVKKPA